jgi:predicted peptidase
MRRFLLVLLVLIGGCESATAPPAVYPFAAYMPSGYASNTTTRYPLILALHGAGGPDSFRETFRNVALSPNFGFILVIPDAGDAGWVTTSLRSTLDKVLADFRVDPDRIYITGMSAGAYAAWRLSFARMNEVAAVVLVAGGGLDEFACSMKNIPTWLVHNQADNVVPPSESIELHDAIQACGGRSRLTINTTVPPGTHPHDAWNPLYGSADFYSWLLRHRRGVPGALE